MKNIVIITGINSSKSSPNKNIRLLNSKTLISYTIEEAIKSNLVDEVFVSTDNEGYAQIAQLYGTSDYPLRSINLSNDISNVDMFFVNCNYYNDFYKVAYPYIIDYFKFSEENNAVLVKSEVDTCL